MGRGAAGASQAGAVGMIGGGGGAARAVAQPMPKRKEQQMHQSRMHQSIARCSARRRVALCNARTHSNSHRAIMHAARAAEQRSDAASAPADGDEDSMDDGYTYSIAEEDTTSASFNQMYLGRGVEPFAAMAALAATDQDRPRFHVQPVAGWINDPTAAFYSHGRYHLFYQHLPLSTDWAFGLVWGHASSSDLVHWERLPDVLEPTPGHPDADGAFSGCIVSDADGTPTILYTGAHCFESTDKNVPAPPGEKVFQETVLAAACNDHIDEDGNHVANSRLLEWDKHRESVIGGPPPEIEDELIGWRDPFVWQEDDGTWRMIIGAGFRDYGGAVLMYKSKADSCTSGWEYVGVFAQGGPDFPGIMWECPFLVSLAPFCMSPSCAVETDQPRVSEVTDETPEQCTQYYMFCISPDGPWQAVLYWIGELDADGTHFDVRNAYGPYRLDAGEILYAPRAALDNRGRPMLWGWLQEARAEGTSPCSAAGYAGCLSIPRVLTVDMTHGIPTLLQDPPEEIEKLRLSGERMINRSLGPAQPCKVEGVKGTSVEVIAEFTRGNATEVGFKLDYLTPWEPADSAAGMVLYNFATQELRVVKSEPGRPPRPESLGRHTAVQVTNSLSNSDMASLSVPDDDDLVCDINDPACQLKTGMIDLREDEPLRLRMFVDGSCVEVFANSMAVLTTRIYRSSGGEGILGAEEVAEEIEERSPAISAIALGGSAQLDEMQAYTMKSCFVDDMCATLSQTCA